MARISIGLYRGPKRGLATPDTSMSRTTRCRCPRQRSRSSSISASSPRGRPVSVCTTWSWIGNPQRSPRQDPPRDAARLRRRPLADTGHDPQPGRRLSRSEVDALPSRAATVAAARIARCRARSTPRRCQSQLGTSSSVSASGGTPQRRPGPARWLAVPVAQAAPGPPRLPARDALLEDGG